MIPICLAIAAILAILKFAGVAAIVAISWWAIVAIAIIGFIAPFLFGVVIAGMAAILAFTVFFAAFVVEVFKNLGKKLKKPAA